MNMYMFMITFIVLFFRAYRICRIYECVGVGVGVGACIYLIFIHVLYILTILMYRTE